MASESCSDIKICVEEEDEEKKNTIELIERGQWLRAAILGANDGLLSTTSLMLGVGAAKDDKWLMIISGLAGAVAGACSMAVGEFVSVFTQRDIELQATIQQSSSSQVNANTEETKPVQDSLAISSSMTSGGNDPKQSEDKFSPVTPMMQQPSILLSPMRSSLMRVIEQDTVGRENNGVEALPSPYKAAGASGLAFLCGSLVPLLTAMLVAQSMLRVVAIVIASSIALAAFGGTGAHIGGAPVRVSAFRVVVGGWISMAVTYGLLKPLDGDPSGHDDIH